MRAQSAVPRRPCGIALLTGQQLSWTHRAFNQCFSPVPCKHPSSIQQEGAVNALLLDADPAGTFAAHTCLQQRTDGDPLLPCRHASSVHLKGAVKALVAVAALQPDTEHVDGAGRLQAAAVAGASGGLHSRAPEVLALVLQEGLVTPAGFRSSKVGRAHPPLHVGILFDPGRFSFCPATPVGVRLMVAFCPDIAAEVRLMGAAGGAVTPADLKLIQGERSCPVYGLHVLTEDQPRALSQIACTGEPQTRWQWTLPLLQSYNSLKVGTAVLYAWLHV